MKRFLSISVALAVLLMVRVFGQGTVMPSPFFVATDSNGTIVAAAKLCTYAAGTTTPQATYSDPDLAIGHQNLNPVVTDSAGRAIVYLSQTSYKFTLYSGGTAATCDGTQLWSRDNITATPSASGNVDNTLAVAGENIALGQVVYLSDGSGGKNAGQWYRGDATNTYSSTLPEIGIATATIASGSTGTVRLVGRLTGLTGLAIGTPYYVGSTGALTAFAPVNSRALGVADTTTTLVLKDIPPVTPVNNPDNGINDFRLTLTSGTPVTSTDVTAATTIFETPAGKGNRIALYDSTGTATVYTSAQFSIAVPATTSQMYDIFAFANGSTPTLELLAWTNDTTRATAIVLTTTGTYTKSGDLTRRYLGSFRTTGVSGQTEDSGFACTTTKRYLWNYYNRVPRPLCRLESTATWSYTLATIRQAGGNTANQVDVVIGVAEVSIDLMVQVAVGNGASDGTKMIAQVGIGEDSTTTFATGLMGGVIGPAGTPVFTVPFPGTARLLKSPTAGRHVYSWNEWSQANGTTTWYGTPAGNGGVTGTANGLSGTIQGD